MSQTFERKYRILKVLKQDTFCATFLATNHRTLSSDRYFIKRFRPILGNSQGTEIKHLLYQEVSVLQRLSGEQYPTVRRNCSHGQWGFLKDIVPLWYTASRRAASPLRQIGSLRKNRQIPRLYEYFMEGEDFYLVREWIAGQTLAQKVRQEGRLPASVVEPILKSILSCLQYIHSHGIVYRQLVPSSIVLRRDRWRIGNREYLPVPIYFGGVKELEAKTASPTKQHLVLANHLEYIPPEQKQGCSVYASDLYSLGLTAVFMLTGKTPAQLPLDPGTGKLVWQQASGSLDIHLTRAIERAICPQMKERFINAEEMLQALYSPPVNVSLAVVEPAPPKTSLPSEVKIFALLSAMGIATIAITFLLLRVDFSRPSDDELVESARAYKTDTTADSLKPIPRRESDLPTPESVKIPTTPRQESDLPMPEIDKIPPAPLGNSRQQVENILGKPTLDSQGYWQNSRALLYEGVVSQRITLGYLIDTDTTRVRQTEVTFSKSVDLPSIHAAAKKVLAEDYSADIERQINQIYYKISNSHEFAAGEITGVIQQNPQEHIYLGIWERGFH